MVGRRVELQDQHLQQAPWLPCLEPGASQSQADRDKALPGSACLALHSWLCVPGSVLSTAAPVSPEHGETPFHPSPRGAARAAALPGTPSWRCPRAALHPSPVPVCTPCGAGEGWYPLWVSLCPPPCTATGALQQHPCRLQGRQHEEMNSGYSRERLGYYLHAEDGLQLLFHTDKQQLCSLPVQHPAPAPGLCVRQAVSVRNVGDAGKALS